MIHRILTFTVTTGFAVFCFVGCGFAQSEQDLRSEIEALKKGQEAIQKELAEIKGLLQPRRAPEANVKDVVFDIGDNPVRGESTAKLMLVEFSDYQ